MTKIRPEQLGHARFLRRGRSRRGLEVSILIVAAVAATSGIVAALSMTSY